MKQIDINKQIGCTTVLFPDNQPHINVSDIREGDDVQVICSITDTRTLMLLLQCANALDNVFANKKMLVIPYLMASRSDRVMRYGDSHDLKVVANLINSCGFDKVVLYDVHSDVATSLIERSVNTQNTPLVKSYDKSNAVLICPDAGAVKKVDRYRSENENIKEVVYCNKVRDINTGAIKLQVLEPEKCRGKNCVIIDDICDGGGTFLAIASQINPLHLTLIVTHGIFSKGFKIFNGIFDEIITSNTYSDVGDYTSPLIKVVPFVYSRLAINYNNQGNNHEN